MVAIFYTFDVFSSGWGQSSLPKVIVSFTQRPQGREPESSANAKVAGALCDPPFACGNSAPSRRAVASWVVGRTECLLFLCVRAVKQLD